LFGATGTKSASHSKDGSIPISVFPCLTN
jgi:hypothetical protein